MAVAYLDIKKWGNSLGVRIPAVIAREARLKENQKVRIETDGDQVTIRAADNSLLSLEQRLEIFDKEKLGGEIMAAQSVGAEVWE
jgi:antitoxin MazE